MSKYGAEEKPEFEWSAPTDDGPDSEESREQMFSGLYNYLRHCALNWKLDHRPPLPPGITHRDADNIRGMLAVAAMCGQDWLPRGHEAIVTLFNEMNARQPKALIRSPRTDAFELRGRVARSRSFQSGASPARRARVRLEPSFAAPPDSTCTPARSASMSKGACSASLESDRIPCGRRGCRERNGKSSREPVSVCIGGSTSRRPCARPSPRPRLCCD